MSGKLQDADHKSLAELISAGGSASGLLNDTKIYVTGLSLNKQLSQAIIDGDLSGGGGSTAYGLVTTDASAGNKTVSAGTTLFIPYLTVSTGDTYTVDSGARLLSAGTITVNGTLTVNGTVEYVS
jgi:tripartite-type tricarboxylate transporter receptor subunit TctC